ncbi:MAG: apolipoprotein N-acyltransferase [Burkholderiales bacterium]|nr:apolipoprotein N-acyltransferase [Burkholderiales bacterium]
MRVRMHARAPIGRAPLLALVPEAVGLAALGALQTLAFVHAALWPLPLLAAAVLAWRLDAAPGARRAAALAWCYGFAWLASGTWWLFVSMHRYGHLPAWLAALAVALLAALLSLYLALAGAAYRRWRRGGAVDPALFAAVWLLAELARGVLFTGFPWVASGYSQVEGPLAALAPWIGVYGIGAVLAALAAGLARAVTARGGRRAAMLAVVVLPLLALAFAGPGEYTRAGRTLTVQLLQPNVPQDQKFDGERLAANLQWLAGRFVASTADLVVAPETAVPMLPRQLETYAPGLWDELQRRFAQGRQTALVGVPLGEHGQGYTNSAVGFSAAAAALPGGKYRYDKHHLVPFGEFVPMGFRWFTEMMRIPLGDFERGGVAQPSLALAGERAAPNICYEDLFGEELARRFADPAAAPTLFVNLSNIAWFGDTIAVPQHLAISRMRALEFQLPMIRATNTGATAVIDHRGRVGAQLPAFSEGALDGSVEGRHGATPYARWASRAGLWPLLLVALAAVAVFAARRPRSGRSGR